MSNSNFLSGSSNAAYHADTSHLSSSAIKLLMQSPDQFKARYIDGIKEPEREIPAFVEGTFTHTLILEPEIVSNYAIYPGLRKAGTAYNEFVAANPGKIVISAAQESRCLNYFQAYQARVEAVNLLSNTISEHTMVGDYLGVPLKARADAINIEQGILIDIKTTIGPSDVDAFKLTVQQYSYDMSAALYCQLAYQTYGKLFDWYFVVISKTDLRCEIYKASSAMLSEGLAKLTQGVVMYKKCLATGIWDHTPAKPNYDSKNYEIQTI